MWLKPARLDQAPRVVATRRPGSIEHTEAVEFCGDVEASLPGVRNGTEEIASGQLWVIGGGEINTAALPYCDRLELTIVEGSHEGDAFFPDYGDLFEAGKEIKHDGFRFLSLRRRQIPGAAQ